MRSNARSKLQFRIIIKCTNQVETPRRDWICSGIRVIQWCVQFWCLKGIGEPGPEWNNPHTLVPRESGLMMTPYQWTQDKYGNKQQTGLQTRVWANSSMWYPITTPESLGLMPIADSESTMVSDGTKPGKEDPPHHAGKAEGLGDSLPNPQSCMTHHIDGMAWNGWLSSRRVPLLKVVEGTATLCISGVGWWPSPGCTYACHK